MLYIAELCTEATNHCTESVYMYIIGEERESTKHQ